jgi:hypothetical protein
MRLLGSWSWRIVERIDQAILVVTRVMVGLVGPAGSFRRLLLLVVLVVVAIVGVATGRSEITLNPSKEGHEGTSAVKARRGSS